MLPLERAMSGVFHHTQTGANLTESQERLSISNEPSDDRPRLPTAPSRMTMDQRRASVASTEPEWCLRGTAKVDHPVKEFLTGSGRGFALALSGKIVLGLLFALAGRKKAPMDALREACSRDALRFASFVGAYLGTLRGVNALLYRYRGKKDDRINAFVAGGVASLAMLIDDVDRRRTIAIYVFVRAMSVLVKALSRDRVLPYWEHAESALFGIMNVPIMYAFLLDSDLMDQGYYKWILNMGVVTHDGLHITLRQREELFQKTGIRPPFQPCGPHYHDGNCTEYCVKDWVMGLGRAGKIYAPVHLLPLLLFRYDKLLKNPAEQIKETSKALVMSCLFLSSYVFLVKYTNCTFRNIRQKDDAFNAGLGGLLTGFACVFERSSRVSELMLYCVPKAMEVSWNYAVKYWGAQPVPYFEIPMFMVGSALLASALREDLKSTYFNVLKFVVGQSETTFQPKKQKKAEGKKASEDDDDDE